MTTAAPLGLPAPPPKVRKATLTVEVRDGTKANLDLAVRLWNEHYGATETAETIIPQILDQFFKKDRKFQAAKKAANGAAHPAAESAAHASDTGSVQPAT